MQAAELTTELEQARTRRDWVVAVSRYFASHALYYGHGTDCAEDEAWWLVWQLSGQPAESDAMVPDPGIAAHVAELARRRVTERLPLAYLLGWSWFAGLEFAVTPSVLVPRSPLAELIEQRFAPWVVVEPGDRILEVGTGSGCIAIAAAVLHPDLQVDATEIDPAALAVARDNLVRHGVGARVNLIAADLYPPDAARYRVIISNPPYVPTAAVRALPPEYGHEPAAALDGGADGLDVVRRLLDGARQRLTANGVLIVEVGLVADALIAAFPRVPWTWIEFERGGDGVFVLTADELSDGWR
jgi:ribosomal protein L3 glutamine methyltransferase